MLDAKLVRENLETVQARLRDRGLAPDFGEFLAADESRRRVLTEVERAQASPQHRLRGGGATEEGRRGRRAR